MRTRPTRKQLLVAVAVLLVAMAAWLRLGPVPALDEGHFQSTRVVDRNGVVLFESLSARGNRSEWLAAGQLPERVVEATVAAEDRRFYRHVGIDPVAVGRAALHDARKLALVEGGSTITQQVAKMLLDSPGRGVLTKMREAMLALRLEHRYSKREILALYLNLAPYGNQTHGIVRASRRYFGCAPEDLTVAQAAFLAALPQRPSAFNPLRDPHRGAGRQRTVLARMRDLGFITPRQHDEARGERLRFDSGAQPVVAQHFVERVLESAPPAPAAAGARVIKTTLDASLQRDVASIIAAQRRSLLAHGAHSIAVAVLDNASGEWLAWEGSGDYFGDPQGFGGAIDGVVALRQPGSTLKPFTYALAFEKGITPATVLPDVPSSFPTAEAGVVYTPRNYDGRYRGPLRARAALAGSENVPAVALLSRVGPPALLRYLRNAGFTDLTKTADYYGLGITLGDAEVRLEQLVVAYSVFARGGVLIEPRMMAEGNAHAARRLLEPRTAFWITDILSDPKAREFIFGSGGNLDFPFPVAVKTGTSQSYRDNWTIGYTRDVTVGVWVGNFDRQELRNSTGVTGAGPVFHAVMLAAMKRARGGVPQAEDAPIVTAPANVERAPVCALSGLRPSPSCPAVEEEWVASDAPVRFCDWHHQGAVDWPNEYRAWAKTSGLLEAAQVAAVHPSFAGSHGALRITNPPDGSTYMIDPTLRMPYQSLRLRAVASSALIWHVDSRPIGRSSRDGAAEWPLAPGKHTIRATDAAGNRSEVKIYVK
jgi:penicillin-binding protein 1C